MAIPQNTNKQPLARSPGTKRPSDISTSRAKPTAKPILGKQKSKLILELQMMYTNCHILRVIHMTNGQPVAKASPRPSRSIRRGQFVEHYQCERRWRRSDAKPSGLKMCDASPAPACRWRRAHADTRGSNDLQVNFVMTGVCRRGSPCRSPAADVAPAIRRVCRREGPSWRPVPSPCRSRAPVESDPS